MSNRLSPDGPDLGPTRPDSEPRHGRNGGLAEDPSRCVFAVWPNDRWPMPHQCNRKRGFGPDGLYCRQHDPAEIIRRRAESDARARADMEHAVKLRTGRARAEKAENLLLRIVDRCELYPESWRTDEKLEALIAEARTLLGLKPEGA